MKPADKAANANSEKKAGKAPNANVVRSKEFLQTVAEASGLPRQKIVKLLDVISETAAKELKQGKRVQVQPLGTFRLREGKKATEGAEAAPVKRLVLIPGAKFKERLQAS